MKTFTTNNWFRLTAVAVACLSSSQLMAATYVINNAADGMQGNLDALTLEAGDNIVVVGELAYQDWLSIRNTCKDKKMNTLDLSDAVSLAGTDESGDYDANTAPYNCFDGMKDAFETIIFPNTITTLRRSFPGCVGTKAIIAPGVTNIGLNCFSWLRTNMKIILPKLESIENDAFAYNDGGEVNAGFTSIILPASTTTIGNNVFQSNVWQSSLVILATVPPTVNGAIAGKMSYWDPEQGESGEWVTSDKCSLGFNVDGCTLYVPAESIELYEAIPAYKDAFKAIEAIPTGDLTVNDATTLTAFAYNNINVGAAGIVSVPERDIVMANSISATIASQISLGKWSQLLTNEFIYTADLTATPIAISFPFAFNTNAISIGGEPAILGEDIRLFVFDGISETTNAPIWAEVTEATEISAYQGIKIASIEDAATAAFSFGEQQLFSTFASFHTNVGWNFVGSPLTTTMSSQMLGTTIYQYNAATDRYIVTTPYDAPVTLVNNTPWFIQGGSPLFIQNAELPPFVASSRANFELTGGDVATAILNENGSSSFDANEDGLKLFGELPTSSSIYFVEGANRLATSVADAFITPVALGVKAATAGKMSISLGANSTATESFIYLVDMLNDVETNLRVGAYEFDATEGEVNNRFAVQITNSATALQRINANTLFVVQDGKVILNGEAQQVVVTDLQGRTVASEVVGSTLSNFTLQSGMYIVRVGNVAIKVAI